MADNESREELTVEHNKRVLVAKAFGRIKLLFNVLVQFSSPEESALKSGIQWLELRGGKDSLTKAKVSEFFFSTCSFSLSFSSCGLQKTSALRIKERYWILQEHVASFSLRIYRKHAKNDLISTGVYKFSC